MSEIRKVIAKFKITERLNPIAGRGFRGSCYTLWVSESNSSTKPPPSINTYPKENRGVSGIC